jgi:hypothetical protein
LNLNLNFNASVPANLNPEVRKGSMPDETNGSPKNASDSGLRSTRRSARVTDMLNSPQSRKTPLGLDTAWALKLKEAVDATVRDLHVEVLSAKPVRTFEPTDVNDMLFEIETSKGCLKVIRSRAGKHVFEWM